MLRPPRALAAALALAVRRAGPPLAVAAFACTSLQCAQVLGIDKYIDCPEDPSCPTCTDGKKNGDETDVDCGGTCPKACASGKACLHADDCASGTCTAGKCQSPPAATCTDAKKNGDETDIDCGGSCPTKCADTKGCSTGADCASLVCTGAACVAPTCTDTQKNGSETDVDCGGSCPKCAQGKSCLTGDDCAGGSCTAGKCAATCDDQVKDGDETDVDCGGSCPKCADGLGCAVGGDCASGVCATPMCVSSYGWSKSFGDANVQTPAGLAVDTAENVIVAGTTKGAVDFGGGPLPFAGGSDAFVAKLDKDGNHKWSKSFGDAKDQEMLAVASDMSQNVLLAGRFNGTINLGGQTFHSGGLPLGSDTSHALFLAKLDTLGNHVWSSAAPVGVNTTVSFSSQSLAIGDAGVASDVFLAGGFAGSITFGSTPLLTTTGVGDSDVFVACCNAAGTFKWSHRYGGSGTQVATSIAYRPFNVVVAGYFDGSVDFGGGPMTASSPQGDLFVAALGSDGSHIWSKHYPVGDNHGAAVTVDANGRVFIAGHGGADADFGGGPLPGMTSLFLVALDPTGGFLWANSWYDSTPPINWTNPTLAADGSGGVTMAGGFWGAIDFGGGPLGASGSFNSNTYVVRFDAAGKHAWSRGFGDAQFQAAAGVAARGASDVFVAGPFDGQIDFGGGPLTSLGSDVFVARLRTQ